MSPAADAQTALFRQLFDLTGRVAVVTGGLGRLGRQYVRTLSDAGAAVAIFDVACEQTNAADEFDSASAFVQGVDISHRADVEAAVQQVVARLGTPDILVNNAGLGASPVGATLENGPFEDYPEAAWDAMIDSHLKGTFLVSQAFLR